MQPKLSYHLICLGNKTLLDQSKNALNHIVFFDSWTITIKVYLLLF